MSESPGPPRSVEDERRLLALVDHALELSASDRRAFLDQSCAGDVALRQAADAMVAACLRLEADGDFLAAPAAAYAEPVIRRVDADDAEHSPTPAEAVVQALAGRYEFVREVGRGGNAVVYLAHDLRHQRDVAIKVIRVGLASDGHRVRFQREITIAAQLQHPYIVPLLDSGEAGGVPFYVMPYIDGESLRQHLDREGALAMADVVSLARDMSEALDAAHDAGIVHRDVKPQNVLLRGGHALVADFGIALALEAPADARVTEIGTAVGTPMYMSPEQALGNTDVDRRSDVYSLGCVVYEMLAGEAPYPSVTPYAVRSKHLHAPVPDLSILRPAVPAGVSEVLAKALAKQPADRFATAGEFARSLADASEGQRRRQRTWRPWAFAAVALIALSGGWWLSRRAEPSSAQTDARPSVPTADLRRIAVLYFDNLSGEEEVGRIADGLTEDLIDALSQVRGLRLISPNGVRPLRERPPPIDSIGRLLQVGTVVGGSLSASAQVVRASVRLMDPRTGVQIDTRTLEVPRSDVLSLRRAVATEVAAFLRRRLGDEVKLTDERQQTRSLAAWEAVQRAEALARDGAAASTAYRDRDARDLLQRADSLYAVAQRLDRSWAVPTIGRGWVALKRSVVVPDDGSADPNTLTQPGLQAIRQAIAYGNEGLRVPGAAASALALRGYARQWLATLGPANGTDTLLRQAEADLRAALDERPDDARSWYALGEVQNAEGRFPEALQSLRNAYDGDAYLTEVQDVVELLFFVSLYSERYDDAATWCTLGQTRYAEGPRFALCSLTLLGWRGKTSADVAEGWRQVAQLERGSLSEVLAPRWAFMRYMVGMVAARAGMTDSARAVLRSTKLGLAGSPTRDPSLQEEAYLQLLLGDHATAAQVLGEQLRQEPRLRVRVAQSPWFKALVAERPAEFPLTGPMQH